MGETQSPELLPVSGSVALGYISVGPIHSPQPRESGGGGGGSSRPTVGQVWPRGNGNG